MYTCPKNTNFEGNHTTVCKYAGQAEMQTHELGVVEVIIMHMHTPMVPKRLSMEISF